MWQFYDAVGVVAKYVEFPDIGRFVANVSEKWAVEGGVSLDPFRR